MGTVIRSTIIGLCANLHVLCARERVGVGPSTVVDQVSIEEKVRLTVVGNDMSHVMPSV